MTNFTEAIKTKTDPLYQPLLLSLIPVWVNMAEQQRDAIQDMLLAGDAEAPEREALKVMTPDQATAYGEAFTAMDNALTDKCAADLAARRKVWNTVASTAFTLLMGLVV